MVKNWYIGLAISAMSVMFGSLGSTVLLLHHMATAQALAYGGLLGGLAFLGSALGALILPPVFEKYNRIRTGLVTTGVLMFIFTAVMTVSLSYSTIIILIGAGYFFFGIFGNAYWSMAMTLTTRYVSDPAQAGFATSMYSVFTNLGVAFIPVFLGPEFGSLATITVGVSVVLAIEVVAMILAPFLKVRTTGAQETTKVGER
jgi:MFS family permease